jgi:hypothetical protein
MGWSTVATTQKCAAVRAGRFNVRPVALLVRPSANSPLLLPTSCQLGPRNPASRPSDRLRSASGSGIERAVDLGVATYVCVSVARPRAGLRSIQPRIRTSGVGPSSPRSRPLSRRRAPSRVRCQRGSDCA